MRKLRFREIKNLPKAALEIVMGRSEIQSPYFSPQEGKYLEWGGLVRLKLRGWFAALKRPTVFRQGQNSLGLSGERCFCCFLWGVKDPSLPGSPLSHTEALLN